jgi:hypothetical protein
LIIEYIAFFIGGKLYVFHNTSITNIAGVTTPVWAKCEDETHTPKKWELGVLLDSQKFRAWFQGSKHLELESSLYRWKGLEVEMSKMALHEPFGHLQPKLWAKEGPKVKLAVWFPSTKSRESTWIRRQQVECNTTLKISQREIQYCFRPHPNRRSEQEIMDAQSIGSANRDNFGTPLWESREKVTFGCRCSRVTQRILYGGRWWLPPSPGCSESSEFVLPVACPNTKGVPECELTNLWLVCDARLCN